MTPRKINPLTDNFHLRPARADDIPSIADIAEATDLFPGEMAKDMMAGYLAGDASDLWFVHEGANGPIGFGFCEPERMTEGTWNLLAIGVLPAHQSRGLGATMITYLEEALRQRGGRILLVETLGTPAFERTQAFYHKQDFTEEARIREFYEPGGDKVVFWKRL